jgi:hypothetical protein
MQSYEWIFSGIGVSALTALAFVFRKLFRMGPSSHPKIDVSVTDSNSLSDVVDSNVAIGSNINQEIAVHHHYGLERSLPTFTETEPTPRQLGASIDALTPFDQQLVQEKYKGLKVLWFLPLYSVLKMRDDTWCVTFFDNDVRVDTELIALTPELKVASKGDEFWIRGKIERASSYFISLEQYPEILRKS